MSLRSRVSIILSSHTDLLANAQDWCWRESRCRVSGETHRPPPNPSPPSAHVHTDDSRPVISLPASLL